MMQARWWAVPLSVAAVALAPGCSAPPSEMTQRDAGADSGMAIDAGVDAGDDDQDRDGISRDVDCNDMDPTVGATAARPCDTTCGAGMELCTDGHWGACSGPTDCVCDTPGEMRTHTCGMCGMESQRCGDDLRWASASGCLGQGACEPSAAELEGPDDHCMVRERLCSDACTWGDWEVTVAPGECISGMRLCDGSLMADRLCDATCHWVDDPDCHVGD